MIGGSQVLREVSIKYMANDEEQKIIRVKLLVDQEHLIMVQQRYLQVGLRLGGKMRFLYDSVETMESVYLNKHDGGHEYGFD